MQQEESVQLFRSITDDQEISPAEIKKYLKWGNGNIEQALNYYYRKKEKQSSAPQKTQPVPVTRSRSSDAFQVMGEAMVRHKRTEEFIARVREEYQLPITKRKARDGKKRESKEDEEMDLEFADADYLPDLYTSRPNPGIEEEASFVSEDASDRESNGAMEVEKKEVLAALAQEPEEEEQPQEERKISERKQERQTPAKPNFPKSQSAIKKTELPPSRFEMIEGESEIFLGQVILSGFAIKFESGLDLPQDTPIQFRYFVQEQKKKKSFAKKADKNMNLRLAYHGSEFGRLKDEQVKIVAPLLMHGMVRMELRALTIPRRIDYYTNLTLWAKFYILRKAITEPVVQTFEGHSENIVSLYKPVAEELIGLLDRVQLPVRTWPLIKKKSKLTKGKGRTQSQAQPLKKEKSVTELEDERRKLAEREQRMRNDPHFKVTQIKLSNWAVNKEESTTHTPTKRQEQEMRETLQKSGVKMKVVEINHQQEDKCAQLVDLFDQDLLPYQPSNRFTSHLYQYQALALSWMVMREGDSKMSKEQQLHPLWTEYELKDSRSMFFNELTSQISLRPPLSTSKCLGGILADEMGLGKTVMMAALMATKTSPRKTKKQGGNLVVVPLTLLSQWDAQIKKHTRSMKTLCYYAQQRQRNQNLLSEYDVVITTYGTLSHQFSKGFHISKQGLYKPRWQRVVLDEAHYIKGRVIQTAKAAYEVEGTYRWCLTGTPLQNGLADLFSLVHFIKYTPWAEYECWNKYINKPKEEGDEEVFTVLRTILKRVFLRRTKQSKDHQGKNIVQLPNKVSRIEILQMSEKQRQFYDSLYQSSRLKFDELEKMGILEAKYMQVFEMLMRLRQICCHPLLFKAVTTYVTDVGQFEVELRRFVAKTQREGEENQGYFQPVIEGDEESRVQINDPKISQSYIKEVVKRVEKNDIENCLVCLNDVEDGVITSCLHIFCRTCAIRQIEECGICSACRRRLGRNEFISLPRENRFNRSLEEGKYFPSTKLITLTTHLTRMKPDDKAVVFSQFLGMLDLIQHHLQIQKIPFVRMEGATSQKDRTKIIEKFQKDPSVRVLVVSLKTGGVGLNLVAANKVFLVDPWWNPGVQEQAIERVHRIGQKREVEVVRFVMDRTIETRMLDLNTEKRQLSARVLSQDDLPAAPSRVEKLKLLMRRYE